MAATAFRNLAFGCVLLGASTTSFGASPLRIQCDQADSVRAHALVCEYSLLRSANERLVALHEELIAAGKGGRVHPERWLRVRDGCQDVDCIDRALDKALAEAENPGAARVQVVDLSRAVRAEPKLAEHRSADHRLAEPKAGVMKVALVRQMSTSARDASVRSSAPAEEESGYGAVFAAFGVAAVVLGALLAGSWGRAAACAKCGKWFARRETRSANAPDGVYTDEHFMRLDHVEFRCRYCGSEMAEKPEEPAMTLETPLLT